MSEEIREIQRQVCEALSGLDQIDEKLGEVREKAKVTTFEKQDVQRLFLLVSGNMNELEKTASRLRNELTELYKKANNKLDEIGE